MGILSVKLLNEVFHEQSHHGLIRIGLSDANVDVASLVNSSDHTDSWLDLLGLYTVVCTVRPPVHSSKITHSKPSFIQRDVVLFLEVGAKKVYSPSLA